MKDEITIDGVKYRRAEDSNKYELIEEQRQLARAASGAILGAFVWDKTVEGHDFWSGVKKRLSEISEGADL